jgi:uncharacterized protein (TIGR03083 family)
VVRRRRTVDEVRPLLEQCVAAVGGWIADVTEGRTRSEMTSASVLRGWSLRDLVAHLVLVADSVSALEPLPRTVAVLTVPDYLAGYAEGAEAIAERTRRLAEQTPDLAAAYRQRWLLAWDRLDALAAGPNVQARRGPVRLADFLVTRVVELVVHADDLARSAPWLPAPGMPPEASRLVVRALLDALAERHPGQALEVRVPPVAAVQCLPGPRHTRGTPPGVVETDPLTWTRLAAGRITWAEALEAGRVSASGTRADLSDVLPLL